ncbi:histidine phosphatase family protein [Georgenia wutianyii]|uniref:Histidine phosphatase family protein n=1 Tax=Georgenia wutianyii TaxID=2585135 RepID=A0ABX5VPE3_9MICO|nr:histidine phosphatase family protein [Georgenia wutianyii]QDB80312.1 histidine phosphatase family protein [Georgenia wutianyii]
MSRTTVHLLRHGEVHNPDGVLYGRLEGYRLSDRGRLMAQRVADVLHGNGHDIRLVVASPLQRAQETARPTAGAFGLDVGTDERLIEAGNTFEGTTVGSQRAALASPRYWPRYVNPFRPSWGEPYRDQVARMTAAVGDARRRLEAEGGGEALLVSHQLPIWVTRLFLERRPLWHDPRKRQCSLTSLTSLTFAGPRLVGLDYWEPAADLVAGALDLLPGSSGAAVPRAAQDGPRGEAQE